MKRLILLLLGAILLSTVAYAHEAISEIIVNEAIITYDDESGYPFLDEDGVLMAPAIKTFKAMDAYFRKINAKQHFAVYGNQKFITFSLEENQIEVEGKYVSSVPASRVVNKKNYVPIQLFAEQMGYSTVYNNKSNKLIIALEMPLEESRYEDEDIRYEDEDIPVGKYKVSYFNSKTPDKIVKEVLSDAISLNMS